MSAVVPISKPSMLRPNRWLLAWVGVIVFTLLLMLAAEALPWAFKYPRSWQLPLAGWITDFMKWLMNSADLGLFTFKEFTRLLSWMIEQPYNIIKSFLSTGFKQGQGSYAVEVFPRVSWIAMIVGVVLLGRYAKDWKLGALVGLCFFYLAIFDQWNSAMQTLSSILIAVPVGVGLGLTLGIAGYRSKKFEQWTLYTTT